MKVFVTALFSIFLFANIGNAQQYTWVQKASFPGSPRGAAVGFAIGNEGFVGTGFNTAGTYFNDFYKWDYSTNLWSAIAPLPASARYAAVGFSIGNFGYVGTGASPSLSLLTDFWKYDPILNTWSAIASFPSAARYTATVSVLNGKAYFGLGYNPLFNDFWEYDPLLNSWTQKATFPGGARQSAVSFTLGNYVYFLTGNNGSNLNDMYRYDPTSDTWIQKANFPGNARYGAVALQINGKAVVGTGGDGSTFFTDFYEYDAATDSWCQITDMPALGRRHVAQFSIANQAYLATGVTSASGSGVADLWELSDAIPSFIAYYIPCNLLVSFNNAIPNVTAYHWDFGDGATNTGANPYHTYSAAGTYNVQLIVYYNCGSDTINQQVNLTGGNTVSQFSFAQTPCSYNINFTNNSTGATSYFWDFGDGTTSALQNPSHTFTTAATYLVTLTVNAGQPCNDSVTTWVNVADAGTSTWFAPNCFTPDNDGINDVFEIAGIADCSVYSFMIFNRWGQKVFETTQTLYKWNGTMNSKNVTEGVYLYVLTVDGKKSSGTVSLLR